MLAAMIDGLAESGASEGAGAAGVTTRRRGADDGAVRNGTNLASVMSIAEMCWGDVGLLLSMPRQGLGNSAIASVADDEQQERFDGRLGRHGDHRAGHRLRLGQHHDDRASSTATSTSSTARRSSSPPATAATRVVVWATLDRSLGRAAIKSFVVAEGHARHERSSGSSTSSASGPPTPRRSASRTAGCRRRTCSARPRSTRSRASPARWRPSTTPGRWSRRWRSAARRASLDLTRELLEQAGVDGRLRPAGADPVGRRREVPPDGGRLGGRPPADAAGGLDGRQPASPTRSRPRWPRRRPAGSAPTSPCRASSCAARVGYSETELLEKWARDSKILDIFEGTQQIQQLIVARRVLGLTSAELK